MLDKLRGRQPVVMDKSTMEDVENAYQDPAYEPYVTKKIPKVWHLLVSSLTTRAPEKRLTAKAFLRVSLTCYFCAINISRIMA